MVGWLQSLAPDYMVVRAEGHHTPRLPPSWLLSRRTWRRLTAVLSWLSLYHPPPAMGICTPLLSCVDSLHHKSLLLFLVFIKKRKHQTEHSWETPRIFHHFTCSSTCQELSPLLFIFKKQVFCVYVCAHLCVCVSKYARVYLWTEDNFKVL